MPVTSDPGIALSALHDHLGYWMRLVSNAVSHGFARSIEGQGVTVAEWVLLRMLFDQESAAPSHLAKQMGMTKGAISKLSDRLLDKHLIARAADTADRRAHRLALTAAGRAALDAQAAEWKTFTRAVDAVVSDADAAQTGDA